MADKPRVSLRRALFWLAIAGTLDVVLIVLLLIVVLG